MPSMTKKEREVWRILNYIRTYYQDHLWEKWVQAYKNYFMYKIDRQLKIKDFQTNIKSPVVKMYVDAMWTGIYDNIINFRVVGRSKEDQKKSEIVKNFLERGFSISDSRKELMATVKESLICGAGYMKVWFVNREKKITYRKNFKNQEQVIKEQYPYIKYASVFNIFHDPSVEYFEDSPWNIERKIVSVENVRKYYSNFVTDIDSKIKTALEFPMYFSNYDYNKIKHMLFWNRDYVTRYVRDNTTDLDNFTRNYLSIDYKGNYIEVIEFRENEQLIVLFNGREAYAGPTLLPINKKPYTSIQFNKSPWLAFGNGVGTSMEDIQQMTDELLNLQMDNTKFQIAPMYQKMKGSDVFTQWRKGLEYKPFDVVEVNAPNAIQRIELGSPEFTGVNMIQFLLQMGEMSEWVNSYTMGYQNKVERSATWVSALVQAFKARLLPMVESMNHALAEIAEMWIATAITLMDKNIILRVLDEEGWVTFKDITVDDLLGKFDIEFDAQALKSATREVKRSQLAELLPLAVQAGINMNTWEYFIDMKKLWKEIFEAYEMPQDMVLESKDIAKDKMIFQKTQQAMQAKLAATQWGVQPYWQQQPWQQQPQEEYIDQSGWDQGNLPVGMEWDTRSRDLQQWVPAAVTQEIQPEEMWPEMWAILRDASSY